MITAFAIDPRQALSAEDELELVRLGARLGYQAAWTPSGADEQAFERCLRWHQASGLPTGISVAPASGRPAGFYAAQARRVWEGTGGGFSFGIGSGQLRSVDAMRSYLAQLRSGLADGQPLYLAALGPRMLALAGEAADGVCLNWCSPEQVARSREAVSDAARAAGRRVPEVVEYIRTAVDADAGLARRTLGQAALQYALGPVAYRRHFERMGFEEELNRLEAGGGEPSPELLRESGAAGAPGEVRAQFERLAQGLDVAVVRVLVTRPGDADSARRVLEECAPAR